MISSKHFKCSKYCKSAIVVSCLIVSFLSPVVGQKVKLLTSNDPDVEGSVVNVKWISDQILFDEGVNLYRRPEGGLTWEKINDLPILKGQYVIPDEAYRKDSSLREYTDVAKGVKASDLNGFLKAFVILKAVYNNEFSKFIGIQWDDNSVVEGESYRYMLQKIEGDGEKLLAFSDLIMVGEFSPEKPMQDVNVSTKSRKAEFTWKVEKERFHSVNIYRSSIEEPEKKLQNKLPIVLTERVGPSGKMEYPKIYYEQRKLSNDVAYTYYLAGIDFFGRETKHTEGKTIYPGKSELPESPKGLRVKVDLLKIGLNWKEVSDKNIRGYNIYRKKGLKAEFEKLNDLPLSIETSSYSDVLPEPGSYYYQVSSINKYGNEGNSDLAMAQSLDIYPPEIPQGLSATSDTGKAILKWDAVSDKDVMGYRLYRTIDVNNVGKYNLINSEVVAETSFTDKLPFNARNKFYYIVVAVDSAYNMSDYSKPVKISLPDIVPPDAPFIKEVKNVDGALEIKWLKNFDSDLMGYTIFREYFKDSVKVVTRINENSIPPTKLYYTDLTADKDVEYSYFMKAMDSVGNRSLESNKYPAIIASENKQAAVQIKGITTKYFPEDQAVLLRWQIPSENYFKGVVVFRSGADEANYAPISGIIKGKEFKDVLPKEGDGFIYKIVSYTTTGMKWTSEEFSVRVEER